LIRSISDEAEARALQADSDTAGGYIVLAWIGFLGQVVIFGLLPEGGATEDMPMRRDWVAVRTHHFNEGGEDVTPRLHDFFPDFVHYVPAFQHRWMALS